MYFVFITMNTQLSVITDKHTVLKCRISTSGIKVLEVKNCSETGPIKNFLININCVIKNKFYDSTG